MMGEPGKFLDAAAGQCARQAQSHGNRLGDIEAVSQSEWIAIAAFVAFAKLEQRHSYDFSHWYCSLTPDHHTKFPLLAITNTLTEAAVHRSGETGGTFDHFSLN